MAARHRIDVHHHIVPPNYVAEVGEQEFPPQLHGWSIERSLADMEESGIATAIVSMPPYPLDRHRGRDDVARRAIRGWNEFMAGLGRDHPGRYGMFAGLPILDIDGSLREIEYALDTLKADGIGLETNIGDKWLGDPHYAPLFEELDRRRAVVYTHPIAPTCCRGLVPDLGDSMIEFATDTTRAIARLLFSGSAARYPNIRFIFSHAGGTMPFLVERFTRTGRQPKLAPTVPNGVLPELKKFYYDTAQTAHVYAMSTLVKLVPVSQVLFGTDYPFRTGLDHVNGLAQCGFSDGDLRAIGGDNARRLLTRWQT